MHRRKDYAVVSTDLHDAGAKRQAVRRMTTLGNWAEVVLHRNLTQAGKTVLNLD